MANILCLECDWNDNLKHKSSILPALTLLELNIGIKNIYKTCASIAEFEKRWSLHGTINSFAILSTHNPHEAKHWIY